MHMINISWLLLWLADGKCCNSAGGMVLPDRDLIKTDFVNIFGVAMLPVHIVRIKRGI